ncbi:phosphoribosyl-ATP pyrophosphatase [Sphingomonas changbaiensis NBRC 104936]|uniref:Phosphoribosyl-ATP pyrophosphatase n=1 Tax=Sphingomonas changbaiensis NBRC 104936 TaxID=1219043 RepID=A0A0E9MS98_9SPHN|nr:phosphoribosyl-ATP diphosphatase [Sphingomonas changbaiensis]GAO40424.1 phosphoribosyl-ATP pyrophosphatase [Sphingomonas changbaiensis NBRC 104936]
MTDDRLTRLSARIRARRGADPDSSYVARLLATGRERIAQKVGEEAVEAVIAATRGDPGALTGEAADLVFHLAVLLESLGLSFDDVLAELERREGVSGLAEKAARSGVGLSKPGE